MTMQRRQKHGEIAISSDARNCGLLVCYHILVCAIFYFFIFNSIKFTFKPHIHMFTVFLLSLVSIYGRCGDVFAGNCV